MSLVPRLLSLGWLAIVVALAGCATTPAPRVSLASVPAVQQARAAENVRIFNRVWSLVEDLHYDPKLQGVDWPAAGRTYGLLAAAAPDDKTLYTALNDMVGLLKDSHTHVLSPQQAYERQKQVRARTGFNMTRFRDSWAVSEVLPGTPAETGGVKPGWLVVARNGEKLGERIDIRAADGEVAQWEFLDERDQPLTLPLVARTLSTKPRQELRTLTDGFVYLRFDGFDATDRRWLSQQLKAHRDAPGVVIDLRRNPGGSTISLGITVGEFFDHSVSCGTFIWRGGYRDGKSSWQIGSARYAGRVVVLVDGATGSAAEIFSAVLKDHGRATIVGRKTAGAVLASWFHSLPGGGELQLSRLDYVTPKGRRLENNGVEPDVTVERSLADLRAGRDRDVETALEILRVPARPASAPLATGR
jgi:carboxyl-terminal processing protease